MNNTMTEYINTMTQSSLDKLEEIIENHYSKFIDFFHIFQAYSDVISDIEYKTKSETDLNLTVVFINDDYAMYVYNGVISNADMVDCEIKATLNKNTVKVKFKSKE